MPERKAGERLVRSARSERGGDFPLGRAFGCAASGIGYAFRTQRNLKVQSAFAVLAVVLGFACGISAAQWAVVAVCIALVMGGECMNTAIESVVDLVSPEWNELAMRAKDCAAGAVLVFSIGSAAVGLIVFVPPIASMLFG